MKRKIIISVCLFVFLLSSYLLLTVSDLLVYPLFEEPYIPLGNILTWLGMIALPLSILYGLNGLYRPKMAWQGVFRSIFKVLVVLSVFWFPLSYGLSNNLSASFQGELLLGVERSRIFWGYSYIVAFAPLVFLAVYFIYLFAYNRKAG